MRAALLVLLLGLDQATFLWASSLLDQRVRIMVEKPTAKSKLHRYDRYDIDDLLPGLQRDVHQVDGPRDVIHLVRLQVGRFQTGTQEADLHRVELQVEPPCLKMGVGLIVEDG